MGPFPHPSINKEGFVLIFVDYFSHFTWIYFLRQKCKVFQHLKDFKDLVETQSGKKIKVLWTDNGGEYANHEIHETWIQLKHTVPYTPQQNKVVEWKNISLKEISYCMLHAKSLPQRLWAEELNYATYIQKYLLMYLSRIRPPTRLGVASNWKWPTFTFLVHMHGPRFPQKRKALDP